MRWRRCSGDAKAPLDARGGEACDGLCSRRSRQAEPARPPGCANDRRSGRDIALGAPGAQQVRRPRAARRSARAQLAEQVASREGRAGPALLAIAQAQKKSLDAERPRRRRACGRARPRRARAGGGCGARARRRSAEDREADGDGSKARREKWTASRRGPTRPRACKQLLAAEAPVEASGHPLLAPSLCVPRSRSRPKAPPSSRPRFTAIPIRRSPAARERRSDSAGAAARRRVRSGGSTRRSSRGRCSRFSRRRLRRARRSGADLQQSRALARRQTGLPRRVDIAFAERKSAAGRRRLRARFALERRWGRARLGLPLPRRRRRFGDSAAPR